MRSIFLLSFFHSFSLTPSFFLFYHTCTYLETIYIYGVCKVFGISNNFSTTCMEEFFSWLETVHGIWLVKCSPNIDSKHATRCLSFTFLGSDTYKVCFLYNSMHFYTHLHQSFEYACGIYSCGWDEFARSNTIYSNQVYTETIKAWKHKQEDYILIYIPTVGKTEWNICCI